MIAQSFVLLSMVTQVKMVKLIIDTDGVSDDIRAISLAMKYPDAEIIAFTTTYGGVKASQATANVVRTQRAMGLKKLIPVYQGCDGPLIANVQEDASFFFGKDGIGDVPNTFPEAMESDFTAKESEHAALALIRLTKEHSNITLVCIGPLTNVAMAIKLDSDFSSRLEQLVFMGGNYLGIGNVMSHSSAEYNFHCDPEAAAIVVKEIKCHVTVIPWEAFFIEGQKHEKEVNFTEFMLYDTPIAKYLLDITKIGRDELGKNGRQYAFCDEIAVAVALNPESVIKEKKTLRATVELAGTYSRGQMVIDWMGQMYQDTLCTKPGKNLDRTYRMLDFITSYNVQVVNQMMHNTTKHPNHSISKRTINENC